MSKGFTYTRADGFVFKWNGSRTVNIYRPDRVEVDVFSLDYGREWGTSDHRAIIKKCDEWKVDLW